VTTHDSAPQERATERVGTEPLPKSVVLGLAIGHGGMSILINLLGILLVFFYLPPDSAGLPQLVTDTTFLLVLNAIVLVAAAGRITDAITDPLIAVFSDRSTHPNGRRIPFMTAAAVPAAVLTALMFIPPFAELSGWNIVWLLGIQFLLYIALTAYVTPAFSLVADLGRTPAERLDLATWTSVSWAFGIVIAATTPFLSSVFDTADRSTVRAWQIAVVLVCSIAAVAMLVPRFTIDERVWASRDAPGQAPLRASLARVFGNPYFRFYVAADLAYFCGLMIIQTGLLYYVTVLLELDEELTGPLLLLMIVVAMVLYPFVNSIAKEHSGKRLVVFAFAIAAFDFIGVIFLGRYPFPNWLEAVLLIVIFSIPFAILSVIPGWILTDIAEHSARTTGEASAAMFFAARTFMQKISQTVGVILFALLTSFGRDIGDDLGIRLSGLAGVVLYAIAALLFMGYDEDELQMELATIGDGEESP
jgi:GPH family glycoside/pentoside/hexuronide:cation symporter